ncbi:MAG: sulfite exporter TauE/SafE family protein [Treponema sp.]|nr:sulfite exporter TauE/SafE family protein [Treponema sp.]
MTETMILLGTSISIALIHTLIGVDHYIPFIALSKANNWAVKKTIIIVLLCGIGHVMGSVLLGFFGIALSAAVTSLVNIEDIRGVIATYVLIAFGLIYTIYGIRCAVKNKTHTHTGADGKTFFHSHAHDNTDHKHSPEKSKNKNNAFWGLFIFFVLGPCEPLIPLLMYPAATMDIFTLVLVTVSFSVFTISVMLVMTLIGLKGFQLLKTEKLEKYAHALAGSAILICGLSVLFLPI